MAKKTENQFNSPKQVAIVSHLFCKPQMKIAKTKGKYRICFGRVSNRNWFDFILLANLRIRNF